MVLDAFNNTYGTLALSSSRASHKTELLNTKKILTLGRKSAGWPLEV